nr:GLPGLI family protein [Leeuwenhoekiella aestuarii]
MFLLLIFVVSYGCLAQVKSGRIDYKILMPESAFELKSVNISMRDYMKNELMKLKQAYSSTQFRLKFNHSNSMFKVLQTMSIDGQNTSNDVAMSADANGIFYTDAPSKSVIRQVHFENTEYLVKEEYPAFEWKILDKTKQIGQYTCYKAVAIKKLGNGKSIPVEAWVATSLPFNYGPTNYSGAGGLILELKTPLFIFKVSEIRLFDEEREINFIDTDEELISLSKWNALFRRGWN